MAIYRRVDVSDRDLVPHQLWTDGKRTLTLGVLADTGEWCVLRSDLRKAAVFPAPYERKACEFGDTWMPTTGWTQVEVPSGHGASADQTPSDVRETSPA